MSLAPRIDRVDRNHVINGGMDFWQRFAGNTTTINTAASSSGYTTDRYMYFSEGTTVKNYSIARSASVPTIAQAGYQFSYSRRWQCITAVTSPAANDYVYHTAYRMEGQDYVALHGNKTIGVGFWIRTNVLGDHAVYFTNGAYNRAYSTSFNIAAAEQNNWVYKTITIQTDSAGTWAFDNTLGFEFGFGVMGSTNRFAPTQNSWYTVSGAQLGYFPGAANLMSTVGNFVELTGLSLQVGAPAAATQFTRAGRSYGAELDLCQRYFEKSAAVELVQNPASGNYNSALFTLVVINISNAAFLAGKFATTKRAIPTMSYYSPETGLGGTSTGVARGRTTAAGEVFIRPDIAGVQSFSLTYNSADNGGNTLASSIYFWTHWAADAEL